MRSAAGCPGSVGEGEREPGSCLRPRLRPVGLGLHRGADCHDGHPVLGVVVPGRSVPATESCSKFGPPPGPPGPKSGRPPPGPPGPKSGSAATRAAGAEVGTVATGTELGRTAAGTAGTASASRTAATATSEGLVVVVVDEVEVAVGMP